MELLREPACNGIPNVCHKETVLLSHLKVVLSSPRIIVPSFASYKDVVGARIQWINLLAPWDMTHKRLNGRTTKADFRCALC